MKRYKLTFGVALAAVVSLSGCSGFLDEPTDTRIDPETDEQLAQVLTASYIQANYGWMAELYSDNMVDNNAPDANGLRYNLGAYDQGDNEMFAWEQCNSNVSTDSPTSIWGGCYASIAGANAVLEKLQQKEARQGSLTETQKAIKGEALLMRSYGHFILANLFCEAYRGPELSKALLGIPYIKKPETTVKPHYDRGTLAGTYDNIQADIVEALGLDMANAKTGVPLVNNSLFAVPKYHFNTSAGYAFAAKFFVFARNYQMALVCADAAFGGSQADASQYLTDVYSKVENFYYIKDFGLYNQSITLQRNFLLMPTYSTALRRVAGGNRYACTRTAAKETLHGPGPTWAIPEYHFVLTNASIGDFYLNPAYSFRQRSGKIEYGMYLPINVTEHFEYTDKLAGIGYPHVTRSELTGDETLLIRAEAKLFLGDKAGAIEDLKIWENNLRKNVGVDSYGDHYLDFNESTVRQFYTGSLGKSISKDIHIDELYPCDYSVTADIEPILQCVIHFRRLETLHTGLRWFDIKRFGLEFKREIGKDRVEYLSLFDARRAFPIPAQVEAAGLQPNKKYNGEARSESLTKYTVPYKK